MVSCSARQLRALETSGRPLPLEDRPHLRELVVEELAHVAWQVGGLSVVVEHEVDDLSTRCALHAAFARCRLL